MLGEVLGLIGLMAIIATCCCSGYNKSLIKRYVKQNLIEERSESGDSILDYWKCMTISLYNRYKKNEEEAVIDLNKLCKTVDRLASASGLK